MLSRDGIIMKMLVRILKGIESNTVISNSVNSKPNFDMSSAIELKNLTNNQ